MTSKHTPGPWRYQGVGQHFWITSAHPATPSVVGTHVAELPYAPPVVKNSMCPGHDEAEANARLIAAAPETAAERDRLKEINAELLAACDAAISLWDDLYSGMSDEGEREVFETMRAAIAKARG